LDNPLKRRGQFKTVFLTAFVVLVTPAFLVERHLERLGLVDVLGSWYTLEVAVVFSTIAAAAISFVLVGILR
jgi:hypothetical protein